MLLAHDQTIIYRCLLLMDVVVLTKIVHHIMETQPEPKLYWQRLFVYFDSHRAFSTRSIVDYVTDEGDK